MRSAPILAILAAAALAACAETVPTDVADFEREVAASVVVDPTFNPATGNYYQAVEQLGVTWGAAHAVATGLRYQACPGHLATVTSQEENDFITTTFPAAAPGGYWLGGVQAPGWGEPAGGWGWITGEPFYFTNWNGGEPNNVGGRNEDRIHFAGPFTAPQFATFWNDEWRGNFSGAISGFVVEFDCPPTGPVVEQVTGAGHFVDLRYGEDAWRTFAFTARRYADGSVVGEYQLQNRGSEFKAHGKVTCFEALNGQVWLGGFETNGPYADDPGNAGWVEVGWTVIDNGQGANAPPDQISLMSVGAAPGYASANCTYKPGRALFDVESGNIQAKLF